jgi:hypothetical protein
MGCTALYFEFFSSYRPLLLVSWLANSSILMMERHVYPKHLAFPELRGVITQKTALFTSSFD